MIEQPVKTLVHPITGQKFKLGRNKPISKGPRLSLSNYLFRKFPAAPPTMDYSPKATSWLNNVLGNDVAGDCTVAAAYHIQGMLLANANDAIPFANQDALTLYEKLSGWNGVEDDPSDTGLSETDVLNYWMSTGLAPGQ